MTENISMRVSLDTKVVGSDIFLDIQVDDRPLKTYQLRMVLEPVNG